MIVNHNDVIYRYQNGTTPTGATPDQDPDAYEIIPLACEYCRNNRRMLGTEGATIRVCPTREVFTQKTGEEVAVCTLFNFIPESER